MSKHFIFSDTHHGSGKVVDYLKRQAGKDGKLRVSSTGDFLVYAAKSGRQSPRELRHGFTDAYRKGDKAGMKKHEQDWCRKIIAPNTRKSGDKFQELKPHLEGGRVQAIMGNSDYGVGGMVEKATGSDVRGLLGGTDSAIKHISEIQVKKDGKTTFVYLPHNVGLLSRYKNKDYLGAKAGIGKDKPYKDSLERMSSQIKKYHSDNIVVLMHEAPKPERWYGKGTPKSKQRLPPALKAHYDSVLDEIVEKNPGKNVRIFHGHLHESGKKRYQYHGVKTRLLDIGDVVAYDTEKGTYKTRRAA